MDAGFSSTVIEQQYHRQLMQVQTEEDPQWRDEQFAVVDGRTKQRASSAALQSSFNNNSQKLVNWLLASDQHRKDNLCSAAAAAIEVRCWLPSFIRTEWRRVLTLVPCCANGLVCRRQMAELSRRKCQRSWQAVEQSRINMYRTLQSVMTDYQVRAPCACPMRSYEYTAHMRIAFSCDSTSLSFASQPSRRTSASTSCLSRLRSRTSR